MLGEFVGCRAAPREASGTPRDKVTIGVVIRTYKSSGVHCIAHGGRHKAVATPREAALCIVRNGTLH